MYYFIYLSIILLFNSLEPETIIKTELDDPDDLDANNSQSTIESSQGSTQLSQASTQPMDDDDEFDQPPLTISTDEVIIYFLDSDLVW